MKRFVELEKESGETPLMALERWRAQNSEYADVPASYAGRLDPMASGKLLVLLGEECKRQKSYTNLDKEYEIEVLLDVGSDTGDSLGIPEYSGRETLVEEQKLASALRAERGAHLRAYPTFSSKTVRGKPLFLYALEGTLASIEIPKHEERIYHISHLGSFRLSSAELALRIADFLNRVPKTDEPSKQLGADFRVDEIRARWDTLLKEENGRTFTVLRLKVLCASGTYMRSLAGRIGVVLGTKALALSIRRTKIGKYVPLGFRLGFWIGVPWYIFWNGLSRKK